MKEEGQDLFWLFQLAFRLVACHHTHYTLHNCIMLRYLILSVSLHIQCFSITIWTGASNFNCFRYELMHCRWD